MHHRAARVVSFADAARTAALSAAALSAAALTFLLAPGAALADAGYDKGFFIRDDNGDYGLRINAMLQPRLTVDRVEDSDGLPEAVARFSLPRARLWFRGHAFERRLGFLVHLGFGGGSARLVDGYLDWAVLPGDLHLRVGHFRTPWSRQQLSALTTLQLQNRSRPDAVFRGGRDIGLVVHNDFGASPDLEWAFGFFNGTGAGSRFNGVVDSDGSVKGAFTNIPRSLEPALFARIGYNHGGIKGYHEPDLAGGPLRFAVAASVMGLFDADDGASTKGNIFGAELDAILKLEGFATSGAFYVTSREAAPDDPDDGARTTEAFGGYLQAGYRIADLVEPVLRYSHVAVPGVSDTSEPTLGVNVYFFGTNLKWATDATISTVTPDAGDGSDESRTEVRVQTMLQMLL